MENNMAATKMAETSTKPPNITTRMSSSGPFRCLCAVSAATLLTASRLSLIKRIPSLHHTVQVSRSAQQTLSRCTSARTTMPWRDRLLQKLTLMVTRFAKICSSIKSKRLQIHETPALLKLICAKLLVITRLVKTPGLKWSGAMYLAQTSTEAPRATTPCSALPCPVSSVIRTPHNSQQHCKSRHPWVTTRSVQRTLAAGTRLFNITLRERFTVQ